MKILFPIFLILTTSVVRSQAKYLSLEGYYQGKNIIVSNPPLADGYGFCVYKVTVNGDILPATIQTSNFEIDFSIFRLKKGEKVFTSSDDVSSDKTEQRIQSLTHLTSPHLSRLDTADPWV